MKVKLPILLSISGSASLCLASVGGGDWAAETSPNRDALETHAVQKMEELKDIIDLSADAVTSEQVNESLVIMGTEGAAYEISENLEDPIIFNDLEMTISSIEDDAVSLEGTVVDGFMVYPAGEEEVSIIIAPLSSQAFETYFVLDASTAPAVYTTTIAMPDGSELRPLSESSAALYDQDGAIIMYISAPWAVDSFGTQVSMALSVVENTISLEVQHRDRTDLEYPVVVDPYYESLWNNVAEATWCTTKGIAGACLRAKNNATKALTQAEGWYPRSLHNGIGDGFRHCYWNALMTVDDGPSIATTIATRHEDTAKGQPVNEKTMDLRNNLIGRNIAGSKGSKTYQTVRNSCKSRADKKTLWYLVSGALKYG